MDGLEDLLRVEKGARVMIEYLPDTLEFQGTVRDEHGEIVSDIAGTLEEMLAFLNDKAQEWLDDYSE